MDFSDVTLMDFIINLIDIGIVWFLIYKLLMHVRGTTAMQLVKGIMIILVVQAVSKFLGLSTVWWLTDQIMTWGFLAIIIIFQPEFRRALESLGRVKILGRFSAIEDETLKKVVKDTVEATKYMSKRQIGALIVFERETGLQEYSDTGIQMDAKLSQQLLTNIFFPNSPMHDGAVIVSGDKVVAASCYLPLSDTQQISRVYGTRHRSAIGITEVTDAAVLVISEETGIISLVKNGVINANVEISQLGKLLEETLREVVEKEVTEEEVKEDKSDGKMAE